MTPVGNCVRSSCLCLLLDDGLENGQRVGNRKHRLPTGTNGRSRVRTKFPFISSVSLLFDHAPENDAMPLFARSNADNATTRALCVSPRPCKHDVHTKFPTGVIYRVQVRSFRSVYGRTLVGYASYLFGPTFPPSMVAPKPMMLMTIRSINQPTRIIPQK